jgi:transketolase
MVPARSRSWPPALNYALPSRRGLSCNKRGFQPPSVPCTLIFNEQDAAYQQAVLGDTLARVAVEAAVQMSWDRYLGLQGCFVGMRGFGESGKIADVYKKFDITTEAVVRAARESLKSVYGA